MTIDTLIARLEWLKSQVGGHCEVRVTDGDDEYGFCLGTRPAEDDSETGRTSVVLIDTTGDQE
ncbi:unnamed protein product [Gemmataceae bacterium]|nr:unnamed protein product [Gemmataceae bacterium]VTU02762.1 unnamed protein product [Gemmataceae bacterium]